VLADCRELLQLYRSEAITGARVARVCNDAFKICVTHGDQASASVFARMAYETRLYLEGQDSPDTQKMKSCWKGDCLSLGRSSRNICRLFADHAVSIARFDTKLVPQRMRADYITMYSIFKMSGP